MPPVSNATFVTVEERTIRLSKPSDSLGATGVGKEQGFVI